jgi:hypothetical protein
MSGVADIRSGRRPRSRLVDTSDDAMVEMLARAMGLSPKSRWERAAIRATIGLHATRLRNAGASGEQGLTHFKDILQRAIPSSEVRTAEQSRVAREMVRWWVEAYYESDV